MTLLFTAMFLLIAFQIKHLIADYYLQFSYMYENKGKPQGWFKPLLDHTLVHGAGTGIILSTYFIAIGHVAPSAIGIILAMIILDIVTHFITDRWKATRGRHPGESKFWTDLGIDQMIHHIVGIIMVGTVLSLV